MTPSRFSITSMRASFLVRRTIIASTIFSFFGVYLLKALLGFVGCFFSPSYADMRPYCNSHLLAYLG